MEETFRLGVDVGGTFTDVVLMADDGSTHHKKVLSTPPDFSIGIKRGIEGALAKENLNPRQLREYTHGATVATNAILTRSGAITGLITTKGFRDVLEIRRLRMPRLYDINWEKPEPLVPRHLRLEVPARMDPWGKEVTPLDEEAAREAVKRLLSEGVESIAVCFLHAYANGVHETRLRELIKEADPKMPVSISSEVLPEIKEYERTSTTVINAYVQPIVQQYFQSMERDLKEMKLDIPIMVMQSNGGMMPSELAQRQPIHIIESGPAAGVTSCHHLAKRMNIPNVMTFDMGGTTAKACLIEEGGISRSPEYEVGGGISIGHRLLTGGGYLLRVPSVDLAEVGAGGGSIAWADEGGALKVGPHSAGANPGPACYDLGGEEPTITDANLYLGLTNPESLAGGTLRIHPDLAEKAIQDKIAKRLDLGLTASAWGIRTVANSSLIRALRAVSVERGRDPRRFVMFGFGGMGPVHAADLATELGITKVVIPPLPGLFSSLGLLFSDIEHHLIHTSYSMTDEMDFDRVNSVLKSLVHEATTTLFREGYDELHQSIVLSADTRYAGQDYALTISLQGSILSPDIVAKLQTDFHAEHEKTYGYRSDGERIQIVALRCLARGLPDTPRVPSTLKVVYGKDGQTSAKDRKAYFGPKAGWITVPIIRREDLEGGVQTGPLIIEEDNSLTVVTPDWQASLDEWSNIILKAGNQ